MIPLLLGSVPHLMAALRGVSLISGPAVLTTDMQAAVIAVLTTGSLLKGALDIYGTTNRLLVAYPVIAVLTVIGTVILAKRGESKTPGGPADDTVEIIETAE